MRQNRRCRNREVFDRIFLRIESHATNQALRGEFSSAPSLAGKTIRRFPLPKAPQIEGMKMKETRSASRSLLSALLMIGLLTPAACVVAEHTSSMPDMHWRMIGPFRGGRTRAAAGAADQPNVFYVGHLVSRCINCRVVKCMKLPRKRVNAPCANLCSEILVLLCY